MCALAIFNKLPGSEFQIKNLAKQLASLFVSKQKF